MDIKTLVPTKGHSIIKVHEKPAEAGGLILAGEAQNTAPVIGVVVRESEGSFFKEGTQVVFRKYAIDTLNWINDDGVEETLYILDNREILASVVEEPIKKEREQIIIKIEQNERESNGERHYLVDNG